MLLVKFPNFIFIDKSGYSEILNVDLEDIKNNFIEINGVNYLFISILLAFISILIWNINIVKYFKKLENN